MHKAEVSKPFSTRATSVKLKEVVGYKNFISRFEKLKMYSIVKTHLMHNVLMKHKWISI